MKPLHQELSKFERLTEGLKLPLDVLSVALGIREGLGRTYTDEEWDACFDFADDQAILGVVWGGLKRLVEEERPYFDLFVTWYGEVERLNVLKDEVERVIRQETEAAGKAEIDVVLLKGQGLATMYPKHLMRTPGDVDLWFLCERERTNAFCRARSKSYDAKDEGDLHTMYKMGDIPVEAHYRPTYLCTPKYQRQLEVWTENAIAEERKRLVAHGGDDFPTPSRKFNLVYLLLHMFRHYLFEGIGLRHIVDYYLLLQLSNEEERQEAKETLRQLGVEGFAGAVMWVIDFLDENAAGSNKTRNEDENVNEDQDEDKAREAVNQNQAENQDQVTASKRAKRLCESDAWRGIMLLEAIIEGGNFGKAARINSHAYRKRGWKRMWRFVSRNARLVRAYPSEILWHTAKRFFCLMH